METLFFVLAMLGIGAFLNRKKFTENQSLGQGTKDSILGGAILVVVIIVLVAIFSRGGDNTSHLSLRERELKAAERDVAAVERAVKSELDYPLTAEFEGYPVCRINPLDSDRIFCLGFVQFTNGYGVPIKKKYIVTVRIAGGEVQPLDVDLVSP